MEEGGVFDNIIFVTAKQVIWKFATTKNDVWNDRIMASHFEK